MQSDGWLVCLPDGRRQTQFKSNDVFPVRVTNGTPVKVCSPRHKKFRGVANDHDASHQIKSIHVQEALSTTS